MDAILTKLLEAAPNIAALIILVWMFMNAEDKREKSRVENAAKLEDKRELHEKDIQNMWANYIKNIIETVTEKMDEHERASAARYEKTRITQELIDVIQEIRDRQVKK